LAALDMEVRRSFEQLGRPFVTRRFGQQQMTGHMFERGVVVIEQPCRFGVSACPTDGIDLAVHS
jgi:hypothetical protein